MPNRQNGKSMNEQHEEFKPNREEEKKSSQKQVITI
jgi:hypothetical protein